MRGEGEMRGEGGRKGGGNNTSQEVQGLKEVTEKRQRERDVPDKRQVKTAVGSRR